MCLRHSSQSWTCMYSDTRTRHWHNLTDYKSHQSPTFTLTVDSFDLKYWSKKGNDDCCLTLLLPWVIKTEFLLMIPIQYQADKWWEQIKYQVGDYQLIQWQVLQTQIIRIVLQTIRRIGSKILGRTRPTSVRLPNSARLSTCCICLLRLGFCFCAAEGLVKT